MTAASPPSSDCPLCAADGGILVWRGAQMRVIRAQEAGFPGFYRVVWNAHVAEWSDLAPGDRARCMDVVAAVERVLRAHLQPTKVNLAALGNVVPHLHWHVVARYDWDSHFPGAIWAAPQRARTPERERALEARLPALEAALVQALAPWV